MLSSSRLSQYKAIGSPNTTLSKALAQALLGVVLLAALLASTGCGDPLRADYSKLGLLEVAGTITLDGEPLADAVVFFEHPDQTMSYATTDADGGYRMKFNSEVNGVLPGEKIIRISTTASTGEIPRPSDTAGDFEEADPDEVVDKKGPKTELVPKAYNKESKLKLTLSESNESLNFDLKGDGSTTGPTL